MPTKEDIEIVKEAARLTLTLSRLHGIPMVCGMLTNVEEAMAGKPGEVTTMSSVGQALTATILTITTIDCLEVGDVNGLRALLEEMVGKTPAHSASPSTN